MKEYKAGNIVRFQFDKKFKPCLLILVKSSCGDLEGVVLDPGDTKAYKKWDMFGVMVNHDELEFFNRRRVNLAYDCIKEYYAKEG